MKHLLLLTLLLCCSATWSYGQTSTVTYAPSTENFPNPERGLYHYTELRSPNTGLSIEQLTEYREQESITLIYRIFYLEDFRDRPISEEYLATVRQDFATMRAAGIKCVLRFAYTDKFVNGFDNPPYNDAPPLDLLLEHVEQLAPIIRANVDVMAVMQAGFIGTWGEWYYTDLYTTSGNLEQPSEADWDNRRSLIDKLLQIVPPSRMVQVRYPVAKFALTGSEEPLTAEEAYQNTPRARIAHHNDCFVSSSTDVGTYKDLEAEKAFLEQDSRYLAVGGETCALSPPTSDCPNAEAELARFHWSYLNIDYNTDVLDAWETQGCWDDIIRNLGYRLRLTEATVQNQAKVGDAFSLELSLINEGYASPYNPRQVNIILRNTETGEIYVHRTDADPRRWLPGETITINVAAGIPASLANGNYEVLLQLADPEPAITDRPEYAIRLANENVWEPETGYNALGHTLEVTSSATGSVYQGDEYFTPLTPQRLTGPTRIRVDGQSDDWQNVRPVATASDQAATGLRVFNSADSLFLLVEADGEPTRARFYLDTDNVATTGYQASGWAGAGMDYVVENGQLRAYTGDGSSDEWSEVATARVATSSTAQEVGVALADLGTVPNFFRVGYTATYAGAPQSLPLATQSAPILSLLPEGLATPIDLSATGAGDRAIVYWATTLSGEESELVLERSDDGGSSYREIATLDTAAITYTDRNLTPSTDVRYRLYARQAHRFSNYSNLTTVSVPAEPTSPATRIVLDGTLDDWNGVAPLATARVASLRALRVFNDQDSLYFSVEGDPEASFQLFIDTDNDPATGSAPAPWLMGGADVLVEDGTLYHYSDEDSANPWQEVGTVSVQGSASAREGAVALAALPAETSPQIRLAWTGGTDGNVTVALPTAGRPWPVYRLALAASAPADFQVTLSTREPASRILLEWTDGSDEQGYTVERSEGDSTGFEKIADLPANTNRFLDVDLSGGTTFYYRVRSFNTVGPSVYSPIRSATTEGSLITGLNDEPSPTLQLRVYPNPSHDQATVEVYLPRAQTITLTAYDLWGATQHVIAQGQYAAGTHYFSPTSAQKPSGQLLLIRLETNSPVSPGSEYRSVRLLIQ